ncbi:MAG: putative xylanase/chitin deacetylase [Paenibacillaceae bacterium]|jgi:peptidoglycan/xylan/chitin deacetylase (PgdA/CDA1 family)|nr:putative xylanase/chitin deacetylase [Paenibacillaceae bacterium]
MFHGKMKAVTFSYDDGVTQDKRLVELFNRYGLKATFNLNSELLGLNGCLVREGKTVSHIKNPPSEIKEIYRGHEIAAHTLTHPNLTQSDEAEIIRQVEEDRKNLGVLAGYDIAGMAYPCGGVNNDDRVAEIIRKHTRIQYCRTITSSHSFDIQQNLYRFNPTVYHVEWDMLFTLAEDFIRLNPDEPKIFYIWGHSYEFDVQETWERFEQFCKLIGSRDDIFYGTNRDILLP